MSQERYSRQTLLKEIGEAGQGKISASRATVIGCGGLGTHIASLLVRAGVGGILIADRDRIDLSNLQRQALFSENDIGKSKATVAAKLLEEVNSEVDVKSVEIDVTEKNVEDIARGASVVVDATDNMRTRFIVNDACVKLGIPWIYGGAVATSGMVFSVVPGGPCLRCIFPRLPSPDSLPTCSTVGIVNTLPSVIASIQTTEALKVMLGERPTADLIVVDVWSEEIQKIRVKKNPECVTCSKHRYYEYEG